MQFFKYFCATLILISPLLMASPKITVTFGESLDGFARIKVRNETFIPLACYVAIDGHKVKFQLSAKASSTWITSTDKRFNYKNFSTWCDYLEIHPQYKAYRLY